MICSDNTQSRHQIPSLCRLFRSLWRIGEIHNKSTACWQLFFFKGKTVIMFIVQTSSNTWLTVSGSGGHPARAVRHQPQEVDEPPRGGRGRGRGGGPALLLLMSGLESWTKNQTCFPSSFMMLTLDECGNRECIRYPILSIIYKLSEVWFCDLFVRWKCQALAQVNFMARLIIPYNKYI